MFKEKKSILKIQIQGRSDLTCYVTRYKVSTSEDCVSFTGYKENGEVKVNSLPDKYIDQRNKNGYDYY